VKVVAPGKVLLFGAYSVLEGTEALVAAVNRYAVADTSRLAPSPSREVRAAIGDAPAPALDLSELYAAGAGDGTAGDKLGLGSSAAALVATLGARAAEQGKDLEAVAVRREIFAAARRAHSEAQGGGSGVDIAASTFGGALFYRMAEAADPARGQTVLPAGLALHVFWSGKSARTSELVARVKALAARDGAAYRESLGAIEGAVVSARNAAGAGDVRAFVAAGVANARALADLGCAADAPIVPPAFAELASVAERAGAAFYPSGAGGGDVGVWLGPASPSSEFLEHATRRGMSLLDLGLDRGGLRIRKD